MKYMGSKARIAKEILQITNKDRIQNYVEPFVGGCNMIDKVNADNKIGSDNNYYLILLWQALQSGYIPPESISREFYNRCRDCYNNKSDELPAHIVGYVGFCGSYGGRFFDGGYAGTVTTKTGKVRDYPAEAYRNVMKQVPNIKDVTFIHSHYLNLNIPDNSVIYCDPPYANTKGYRSMAFSSDEFFEWCREQVKKGHTVYVSEYSAPEDFELVWEKGLTSSLRANGAGYGSKKSVERLYKLSGE